ncbi:MAG TPA: SRPBCC domain-containing protein [Cyclobacteriaceae bacterium]|nr:SRPBCC domain-containing protein [Cyclobacteriaceae bacterium]
MGTFESLATTPDTEIVTIRIFNYSRKQVYKAWTNPELLKAWWGPKGFTNTFNTFEFKEGGKWSFIMHGPDKGNYPNECAFTIIREPELIVWDRQSKPLFQVEVRFEALAIKETRVTFKQKFQTVEECEKIRKYTVGKNDENFDKLEVVLSKM